MRTVFTSVAPLVLCVSCGGSLARAGDAEAGSSDGGALSEAIAPVAAVESAAGDTGSDVDSAGAVRPEAACPPGPFPVPAGANRQSVCVGFPYNHTFNEGPVWIASQNAFFFSNFDVSAAATNYNGDIIKYTPGGQCEVFIKDVGTNGLGLAHDGNILATSHLTRTITEFDLVTKQPKIIADNYMGVKFNSPNDIIVHSNGTIYFSNPTYQLGNRIMEMPTSVIRVDPAGALSLLAMGGTPNGVTLSPDEKRLYVEQDGSGVKVYDLDVYGVPTAGPRDFSGGTDGMSVDCAGNVYLSGSGAIISPDGRQVGSIPGGGGTMPSFGGVDGMTLIVVGGGTRVATVDMNVRGLR